MAEGGTRIDPEAAAIISAFNIAAGIKQKALEKRTKFWVVAAVAALASVTVALLQGSAVLVGITAVLFGGLPYWNKSTQSTTEKEVSVPVTNRKAGFYRSEEKEQCLAALKAKASILVTGCAGSGKSVLLESVAQELEDEGHKVVRCETVTARQFLLHIAENLEVETTTLEGKAMKIDQLKVAIARRLKEEIAFLAIDDSQFLNIKIRLWLKSLVESGQPMICTAKDAPKSDLFMVLPPPLALQPLSERQIGELMQATAHKRGKVLTKSELSRLKHVTGGWPGLAIRAIEGEYIGIEREVADHGNYFDITPVIFAFVALVAIIRFIGLGLSDQAMYIMGGILTTAIMSIRMIAYSLPRERGNRIK